jgi:hypothetical protein
LIARDAHLVTNRIKFFHSVLSNQVELGVGIPGELGQVRRALVQEVRDAHLLRLKHGDLRKDLLLTFVATKRRGTTSFSIFRTAGRNERSLPA